jgi:hypothetical protein
MNKQNHQYSPKAKIVNAAITADHSAAAIIHARKVQKVL